MKNALNNLSIFQIRRYAIHKYGNKAARTALLVAGILLSTTLIVMAHIDTKTTGFALWSCYPLAALITALIGELAHVKLLPFVVMVWLTKGGDYDLLDYLIKNGRLPPSEAS